MNIDDWQEVSRLSSQVANYVTFESPTWLNSELTSFVQSDKFPGLIRKIFLSSIVGWNVLNFLLKLWNVRERWNFVGDIKIFSCKLKTSFISISETIVLQYFFWVGLFFCYRFCFIFHNILVSLLSKFQVKFVRCWGH